MFENELLILMSSEAVAATMIIISLTLFFYALLSGLAKIVRAAYGTRLIMQTQKGKLIEYNVTLDEPKPKNGKKNGNGESEQWKQKTL
jgi:hypothetical protein